MPLGHMPAHDREHSYPTLQNLAVVNLPLQYGLTSAKSGRNSELGPLIVGPEDPTHAHSPSNVPAISFVDFPHSYPRVSRQGDPVVSVLGSRSKDAVYTTSQTNEP